eukprot:7206411-Ditylum_brightwellii.AAC.1
MKSFLDNVHHRETKSVPVSKPKRFITSKNKDLITGSIVFLTKKKLKLVLLEGQSIVVNSPQKKDIYSPNEIFSILKTQIESKYLNRVLMLISNNLGTGLVPVSYEGIRKAWYSFRKTNKSNEFWRNLGRKPLATSEEIEDFKNGIFR